MADCPMYFYAEDENCDYPHEVDPEVIIEKWNGSEYVIIGAYRIPIHGLRLELEQGTSHTAQGLVPTSVELDWELPKLVTFIPCQQDVTIIWNRICPEPYCSAISASNDNPDSGEQINLWAEWGGGERHYIVSHVWNFGDGTSSSVSSPWKSWTNTTGSPVTYTVSLEVTNDCGESETKTKSITVETAHVCPTPVITSVSWTPVNPMVGETVQFNGNATAGIGETITMWNWDFGDGTPVIVANEPNPTHVYTTPAIRTFEAVVRNSCDEWSAYYTDDVNVTESMNVFVTMCKGVEEDCGAHRVEQIYGRELFTGNDRCAWLQCWCDFACMSIPWSATNTFDLSSLSIDHEVAVAHIQAVGLMPNANYNFRIKWFDTNNTLIVNETTPYITGVNRIDEIGWLGYCASEITKNGTYRVEVDMFEDDSSIFQTVKTTFDITGIPCPTPTCTFGVI
jgi:PKD repeat protein